LFCFFLLFETQERERNVFSVASTTNLFFLLFIHHSLLLLLLSLHFDGREEKEIQRAEAAAEVGDSNFFFSRS
jgi:hypothetical protein